jgi:SWI/SNF-related matrix-associated actin-dependent regulator 1 of chromatin subfamily A
VQATKIIELRPYTSVADLRERLGQGKKKAAPLKISPRMFEDCVEIFEGYTAVDDVLDQCETIGAELQEHIARWQYGGGKGKGRSSPAVKQSDLPAALNEVDFGEGALTLRTVDGKASRDFLSRQPASLSEDLTLKEYQLLGLNWLRLMHAERHNAILADEMGASSFLLTLTCILADACGRSRQDRPGHQFADAPPGEGTQRAPPCHRTVCAVHSICHMLVRNAAS